MKRILKKAINPLKILINDSRTVGIMLIACTFISLFLANSASFQSEYYKLWNNTIHYSFGIHLPESFISWINNFLMSFFFLMAGMEIKRELLSGELSSVKKALLPFGAALGGMVVPALIFVAFNLHTAYANGWGIPTATDIAFSIGIASLLGKRVPVALKILLMALAIIDDLGAILIVAIFYGNHINLGFLAIGAVIYGLLFACNYLKLKFGTIQIILSLLLWFAIFNSGIEASICGVLVAFATPTQFLPYIEKAIHRYVNFLILPLFALANTAIALPADFKTVFDSSLGLGIIFGLVIGKPLGIFLFSRVMVALNLAKLPRGVEWKQVIGMGTLAGIGFTMSIFTTMLAFKTVNLQDIAKLSILISVVLSLVVSMVYFVLLNVREKVKEFEIAEHQKEENSTKGLSMNLG